MRALRLIVASLLLVSTHLCFIERVDAFISYKKYLIPYGTNPKQQQQQQQSRDGLHHWKKRTISTFQHIKHRLISPLFLGTEQPEFFIRKSLPGDMGRASEILTDGFFKGKTNWITYQWERLETFLSLESTFPKPNTPHVIFVACNTVSGRILGMIELDARKNGRNKDSKYNSSKSTDIDSNGAYMCNVAVDDGHLRKGIATALIRQCESQVQQWHTESKGSMPCRLYLRVRSNNEAAIRMYSKLDYTISDVVPQVWDPKSGQSIYVMGKALEKSSSSPTSRVSNTATGRQGSRP
jgi:ribosomal protein S18 acetylase RimI-like enzyme